MAQGRSTSTVTCLTSAENVLADVLNFAEFSSLCMIPLAIS